MLIEILKNIKTKLENPVIKKLVTSQFANDYLLKELGSFPFLSEKIKVIEKISQEIGLTPLQIIVEGEFLDTILIGIKGITEEKEELTTSYETKHKFLERE